MVSRDGAIGKLELRLMNYDDVSTSGHEVRVGLPFGAFVDYKVVETDGE